MHVIVVRFSDTWS